MAEINLNKVDEILEHLVGLSPSERERFLANSSIKQEVKNEVRDLLGREAEAAASFDLTALDFSCDFFEPDSGNAIGQSVDIYKITRELGSGGMGAVFLAERQDGKLEQTVALKLLKRELNTASLRTRFRIEREILGSLEHPSIARLLNAGTSDDGIPFLAIEFVDGVPIDEFCDTHSLPLEERLKLFITVCDAVAFAHRNLVVHRDLKPSNILVDKNGVPKLLDFGISKFLGDESDDNSTAVTRMGVMTPSYASPEQLTKESVTTATDIYSLGVVLYELVAGVRPFAPLENDLKAIQGAVIHEAPPLPSMAARGTRPASRDTRGPAATDSSGLSTNYSGSSETGPSVRPVKWQQLKGDLDTIILKALKKEPGRRYSSVEAFADDIDRYLKGLPVLARPDTLFYRTRKFFGRNALPAGAALILLIAILVGLGTTLWQARQTALEAERARSEAAKKKEALDFVGSILNFANPFWHSPNPERKRQATIVEAMELAAQNAQSKLADKPEVQAEIFFILGKAFQGTGDYERSGKLILQAIQNYDSLYGTDNLRSMQFRGHLGNQLFLQTRFKEARVQYQTAVDFLRPRVAVDGETKVFLAGALTGLGNMERLEGNFDRAIELDKEALALAADFQGDDRRMVPILLGNLGTTYRNTGELETAQKYFNQALDEIGSRGSVENPDGANFFRELGLIAYLKGDLDEARERLTRSFEIANASLGDRNIYTLDIANHLARVHIEEKNFEQAEQLLIKAETIQNELQPNGSYLTAVTRSIRGELYTRRGDLAKGERELRAAHEYLASNKASDTQLADVRSLLGKNLAAQRKYGEARENLNFAFQTFTRTKGSDHPETLSIGKAIADLPPMPSS